MIIEQVDIAEIRPCPSNAKKHTTTQVKNVAQSIKEFGFVQPLVLTDDNEVIIGHCRLQAAKRLKMTTVPCVYAHDLTPEQVTKLRNLDNKLNESEWDIDLLADDIDGIDFDGFDIDWGLPEETEHTEIIEDEVPEEDEVENRVNPGDIWQLGRHRLMCGDSTDENCIAILMDGEQADLYLTDPPYNVDYTNGQENERKILNDHFTSDEECGTKLWLPAFENSRKHCKDDCSVYCFMPQGGTHMMMMMMMRAGWQVKHELIWRKQSIVMNRADYNYQHEPFMFGWNKKHIFYGKGKYKNTSVWDFDRPTKSKEHPTMKPISLFSEILLNSTKSGDLVLDSFGGSEKFAEWGLI